MLAMPFKNDSIRHFEALPFLPNCISPISAVLILRGADFFFINGIASMKRLNVSHDFGHNTNNHLDRQELNVMQRLSSVPESVM